MLKPLLNMVGVRGFEPPAPASRRQYSTRLSYTPTFAESAARRDAGGGVMVAGVVWSVELKKV